MMCIFYQQKFGFFNLETVFIMCGIQDNEFGCDIFRHALLVWGLLFLSQLLFSIGPLLDSAIKTETVLFARKWMELEDIILREVN